MIKKNISYNVVNILIIFVTIWIFALKYSDIVGLFDEFNIITFSILTITAILVHIVKASRLYLALYGTGVEGINFIKTYCKVTPVSIILPFKVGEFFRMYCYGELIGSALKGIVIILFDRFMDTAALVSVIVFIWLLNGGKIDFLVYLLIVFLIFSLIIYFVFPSVYKFWTKYLLRTKASQQKLGALKTLQKINAIYCEIENVARGRGIILYIMSIIAWGCEIGSLYVLGRIMGTNRIDNEVFRYLNSAMSGSQSIELRRFIAISVILLITTYIVIKVTKTFWEKRRK